MIDLSIINNQQDFQLDENIEDLLRNVIIGTLQHEKIDHFCEISLMFANNEEIRILNRDYRNKDQATDVLSFPQYDDLDQAMDMYEELILGDIVISLEKAVEQAEDFGHTVEREICYLTVHSVLHLLGYDHMTEEDKKEMRTHEEAVLGELGILR